MTIAANPQGVAVIPQALLKRNLQISKEQFSSHWFEQHAAIVIPYFLANGVDHYAQIHNPVLTEGFSPDDLNITEWDGAAELRFKEVRPEGSKAGQKYFRDFNLRDERRFLISEALEHVKIVDSGTVTGDIKVIIEDSKVIYGREYAENEEVWDTYVSGYISGSILSSLNHNPTRRHRIQIIKRAEGQTYAIQSSKNYFRPYFFCCILIITCMAFLPVAFSFHHSLTTTVPQNPFLCQTWPPKR